MPSLSDDWWLIIVLIVLVCAAALAYDRWLIRKGKGEWFPRGRCPVCAGVPFGRYEVHDLCDDHWVEWLTGAREGGVWR